jgi:hypothetical protein
MTMAQAMSQLFILMNQFLFFLEELGWLTGLLTIVMYDELMLLAINYGYIFRFTYRITWACTSQKSEQQWQNCPSTTSGNSSYRTSRGNRVR